MGNARNVNAGAAQWMTAGSGIVHSEMPKPVNGKMREFQLRVNLPRANKMMDPRYQEISIQQTPTVSPHKGITIRVVCGSVSGIDGSVKDIVADPGYFDISMEQDVAFSVPVKPGYTALAYVIGGEGTFDQNDAYLMNNRDLVLFGEGSSVWASHFRRDFNFSSSQVSRSMNRLRAGPHRHEYNGRTAPGVY